MGYNHRNICSYWPEANSEIERFYRTLGDAIRTTHAEGKDWKKDSYHIVIGTLRYNGIEVHVTIK